jgi:anthranilate/para-aminobenzoate synthase component I
VLGVRPDPMIATRVVNAPTDPFVLARALQGHSELALVQGDDGRTTYLAVDPVASSSDLDPEPDHEPAARPHGEIPRWIGLLPYEARRALERGPADDARPTPDLVAPRWIRYGSFIKITNKIEIFSSTSREVDEVEKSLTRGLARASIRPHGVTLRLTRAEPGAAHETRIRRALELIAAGEIYQVNLARRFELDVEGDAFALLEALCPAGLTRHAAALEWPDLRVAAATPELFLSFGADRRVRTAPIKGTRPRVADPARDQALARSLDEDPKERAELAMVIDVERNDLGRLARTGSVVLEAPPHVESYESVHHRLATVAAELRPGVGRAELLEAMLPSGSVTGAPKIRAMEVIRDLEPVRRGLYTGAVGYLREDGGLELGMAIRTLTVRDGQGSYFAGGGIVADSQPRREVEETLWKARRLIDLSGGAIENWA